MNIFSELVRNHVVTNVLYFSAFTHFMHWLGGIKLSLIISIRRLDVIFWYWNQIKIDKNFEIFRLLLGHLDQGQVWETQEPVEGPELTLYCQKSTKTTITIQLFVRNWKVFQSKIKLWVQKLRKVRLKYSHPGVRLV